MEPTHAADSKAAQQYLIDPFFAPEPSDETGPGTHFRSTFGPAASDTSLPSPPNSANSKEPSVQVRQSTGGSTNTNPFRRSSPPSKDGSRVSSRRVSSGYATPPSSASPRRSNFPHREEAFSSYVSSPRSRRSGSHGSHPSSSPRKAENQDQLKREEKRARRSPHLNKRHIPGPDTIDRLDSINGKYHHEGPYDAALLARNTSWKNSPLAALEDSNREAIKATPVENIRDAVERHVPIDGVAIVPPGMPDRFGRTYDYEEGDDMMLHNGGNYRRWPGIGKGEPSYSLDEAMKRHKISSKGDGIEMTTRPRNKSDVTYQYRGHYLDPNDAGYGGEQRYNDWGVGSSGISRSRSTGHKMTEGLKKRLGGIGRKHKERAE
ncbi:Pal1 cell morphology [Neofusicoccum parvum]|uniref:Pal1 cell morphology n=1 Tax=Neofusicoccum parvum TaxID=310453 RepID=A0ACB5RP41_9PEZI|nr:Pal1 cell morphology [Neofusicoccum parvum]GME48931.1 Pal1 cell morphology [Neofusicoccum parvum]